MSRHNLSLRAALCFQEALQKRRASGHSLVPLPLGRVSDYCGRLEHLCGWLQTSAAHGWAVAAVQLREDLLSQVEMLERTLREARERLQTPLSDVPPLRFLLAELEQLDQEFSDFHVDLRQHQISATTEAIELDGIHLGPFSIQLPWRKLARESGSDSFTIVALDANPASTNEDVTHPHVSREKLCAGDASEPIRRALDEGRLCDAFCLVRSVLTTYNPTSPFVALEAWHGHECADCGTGVREGDLSYCEVCDRDFCEECISCCNRCNELRCRGCMLSCSVCDEEACLSCLRRARVGKRWCCAGCLRTCTGCKSEVALDEFDADTELCSGCGEAAGEESDEADHSSVTASDSTGEESDETTQPARAGA